MSSKYEPLGIHLTNLTQSEWRASFAEIEKVIGFSLPKSARMYPPWWANDVTHSHSSAWLEAGWRTIETNLVGETVTFLRER